MDLHSVHGRVDCHQAHHSSLASKSMATTAPGLSSEIVLAIFAWLNRTYHADTDILNLEFIVFLMCANPVPNKNIRHEKITCGTIVKANASRPASSRELL